MDNLPTFLAGFIGALAPEVVRLYQLRQDAQTFQPWYYAISLVYALLGGYVATIAPGVAGGPLWWAFAVGAGLNAVVSLAAKYGAILVGGGSPAPPAPPPGAASRGAEAAEPGPARRGGFAEFWRAL